MTTNWKTCPECDGSGEVERETEHPASFSNPYGYISSAIVACENCGGSGEVEDDDWFEEEE